MNMGVRMRGKIAGLGGAAAAVAAVTTIVSMSAAGTASASVAAPAAAQRAHVAAAAAYTPPARNLKQGMTGADVKALQTRLAALKYYPGPIDGQFGSGTLEAVWAFQEVNHLGVDGVVGPATKAALVHPTTYKANDPKQAATRVEVNLKLGVLTAIVGAPLFLHLIWKTRSGGRD